MKPHLKYEYHHLGIPLTDGKSEGRYSPGVGMYTADNPGKFRIQWHRFSPDSPLPPLLKTLPHVAFRVDDLQEAIEGEEVILGPYEPIEGFYVAIINDAGVPIELVQTLLSDNELWEHAMEKKGMLYEKTVLQSYSIQNCTTSSR